MEAIVLLGGPGAGKGTLAETLKKHTPYIHVSTGDMLRAAVRSGSPIGLEVKACMDNGQLASDDLILELIKERISQEPVDAKFMFDGFPRTIEQAKGLQTLFSGINGTVTHVLNLVVDPDALVQRLCGRRTCKTCGAIFHVVNMPPKEEGICDLDGGELYQRADDNEETVMNRLEVYKTQTAPLIDFYTESGLLHNVDAGNPPETTAQLSLEALNA
ncbi:adenylate kinase [Tichowtungia aerotolerans]|uniref:Adenylate kinase n=1 Tax=Tichowtungia aerotolerans TaxID=2697043 RepID=A0A6P1M9G7_9BACT|nr:adenylate kinase [Tichowtungia aerotolerans]QHI68236.1 adenylate kinase [Tichowtungia aerotolerans]